MAARHTCSVCGNSCVPYDNSSLHLHVEIENLKQRLVERENHIVEMETNFLTEVDKYPNGEFAAMAEELSTWQDKYSRLYEAHKRIQKVNQNLEDKLLKIVDKCETEKSSMQRDVADMKQRLLSANATIKCLKEESERNRNDVNTAIQLLQCQPSNFVSQKYESLPADLQQKVHMYVTNKKKSQQGSGPKEPVKNESKSVLVPISTFPPTAMFYSVNKPSDDAVAEEENDTIDIVSAGIVAKILEDRERDRLNQLHCKTCLCPSRKQLCDAIVQTESQDTLTKEESQPVESSALSFVNVPTQDRNQLSPGRSNILRGFNRQKERLEANGEMGCDSPTSRVGSGDRLTDTIGSQSHQGISSEPMKSGPSASHLPTRKKSQDLVHGQGSFSSKGGARSGKVPSTYDI